MAADNAGAAEHLHRLTRDPFMILGQLIFQHGDFGDTAFALADLPNGGVDRRLHGLQAHRHVDQFVADHLMFA